MGGFSVLPPDHILKNSLCNKRGPLALIFTVLLFHRHLLCLPFSDLNNKTERDFDPVSIGDRIITRQQSAGWLHNDPDAMGDVPESRAIDEKCGEGEGG